MKPRHASSASVDANGALSVASLTALTEAAAAITSTLDLEAVLATIGRLACSVARAEAGSVLLIKGRGTLVAVAATGHRRDALMGSEFATDAGIPGEVIRTGEPTIVPDAAASSRYDPTIDDLASLKTRSIMAAPMVHRGEVIGVIEVVNRLDGREFTDPDLKILQIFATLAAGATLNARAHADLKRRFEGLRDTVLGRQEMIGDSPPMREALELCERVARSNATVLLLGETGTGKEVFARHLHLSSRRRDEAFAAVNCAALSETLLESELFGHEKGAFTDAQVQHRGWFENANRGTLFLDEIGDISRSTQAKLLRVLQEREFVRVGGTKTIPCDVRIIAATNRNLKNMMADGLFREDLYYRLSVFPIRIPALRDRREDIPLLVDHFAARSVRDLGLRRLSVGAETMEALTSYDWPGNIRELQNVIERSVLMADGDKLLPCHLPGDLLASYEEPGEDPSTLHGQERLLILNTLNRNDWNQSQTARDLGISRDYLRHRLKKYKLSRPPEGSRSGQELEASPSGHSAISS